ncbi:WXG100 family type VII secretion target [Streptosporangium sp. NBC_01469]|uniref:WXG100 family type VII secretion target n=1 Tax=Streptosporangium sp. NBC_01469 TaxID=2903898 RepID=UPI002E2E3223|nr:hypothetical protein [Streptosporangium sp. NBC_01469]
MTEKPAELLRQAEEKDLLADRFEGYVKNLETLLDRIRVGSVGDGPVWTGPAAQRFERDTSRRSADVNRLAEQCRGASRNLRRSASALRERARLSGKPL